MDFMSVEFADKQAGLDYAAFCTRRGRQALPVNPEDVAEVLWDIPTIFLEEDSLDGDKIAFADFTNSRIVVERCGYEPRERFSAAHEVGHFSLHKYLVGLGEAYDKYELLREKQADAYASALLMPEPVIVPFIERHFGMLATPGYLIEITKEKFNVSEFAARIRLENLNFIASSKKVDSLLKKYDSQMDIERQNWVGERW